MFKLITVTVLVAAASISTASAADFVAKKNSEFFGTQNQIFNAYNGVGTTTYQPRSSELREILCNVLKKKYKNRSCGGGMKLVECHGTDTIGFNRKGTAFPALCYRGYDGKSVIINAVNRRFDLASQTFVN